MNQVILIGNLTKDPELRNTPSGKQVAGCSIATNKTYKDQSGQKQTVSQFHNLVIWGKSAEVFTKYLAKGSKVAIIGEIQTRNYVGQDGIKRYVTEILVNNFEFLSTKKEDSSNQLAPQEDYSQPGIDDKDDIQIENIPF